jgi:hypothetical protein
LNLGYPRLLCRADTNPAKELPTCGNHVATQAKGAEPTPTPQSISRV